MSIEYRNEQEDLREEFAEERAAAGYQRAPIVTPLFSIILIAALILVFICQIYADRNNPVLEGGKTSVLLAGFVKQLFNAGQYWRILTGAVLHGGLMHLFFNCYALFVLGKLIETLSNRAHLAIIFLLAAIGGGILSLIFIPDVPSIGASGGVIGFLGYLTVYGFKRRKLLPDGFLKNMLFNVGLIAFIGIVMPNVDNFGHLGGLLVGAVYGLAQIPGDLYKDPREINPVTKFLGFVALGVSLLTAFFTCLVLLGIIKISFPDINLLQ